MLGAAAATQGDPADATVSFTGIESIDNTYVVEGVDVTGLTFE